MDILYRLFYDVDMPTMDFGAVKKLVADAGLVIGHSTKHHTLETKDGVILQRFAISHSKGGKNQVLSPYVKSIQTAINNYNNRQEATDNNAQ